MIRIKNRNSEDFKDFKLFIDKNKKIHFICLNAGVRFKNIIQLNPKMILLASGTLTPFEILEKQLNFEFDLKFTVTPNIESWKKTLRVIKLGNFYHFHQN